MQMQVYNPISVVLIPTNQCYTVTKRITSNKPVNVDRYHEMNQPFRVSGVICLFSESLVFHPTNIWLVYLYRANALGSVFTTST